MSPSGGDIIANRFQLVRELGRGGMGSVWLADHLTLEVRCAVKLIVGEGADNPEYILRLHDEARAIAQVQSPHVVRVLDHDVCGDTPYIAMELLEGEDLRARLTREGRLDPFATYKIISQIARGLAKAHVAGVVHRDLKPENVFLAEEDDDRTTIKLLDFGIANWARLARAGGAAESLAGTPEYMSPEHARGMGAIDRRADIWALAVIAFECVTGGSRSRGRRWRSFLVASRRGRLRFRVRSPLTLLRRSTHGGCARCRETSRGASRVREISPARSAVRWASTRRAAPLADRPPYQPRSRACSPSFPGTCRAGDRGTSGIRSCSRAFWRRSRCLLPPTDMLRGRLPLCWPLTTPWT